MRLSHALALTAVLTPIAASHAVAADKLRAGKAVAILKDSFIDMGILDQKPGDDQLFTTRFTPVK